MWGGVFTGNKKKVAEKNNVRRKGLMVKCFILEEKGKHRCLKSCAKNLGREGTLDCMFYWYLKLLTV